MKIDPNTLPKVDTSKFCDAEGYYFFVNGDGNPDICLKRKGGSFSCQYTYYGPIEFDVPKPKVIPPKPDAEIVAAEFPDEGNCVKWCLRRGDRLFPISEMNWKVGYVEPFYKVIET